jgi:hypothetical protein
MDIFNVSFPFFTEIEYKKKPLKGEVLFFYRFSWK